MKYRISTFLCCIIAACVTLSCSDLDVDTPENPDQENGTVQPEPEPEPEPEPVEIVPMVDIVFNADGTTKDISSNKYGVGYY